jgi:hypothetical protein
MISSRLNSCKPIIRRARVVLKRHAKFLSSSVQTGQTAVYPLCGHDASKDKSPAELGKKKEVISHDRWIEALGVQMRPDDRR